MRLFPIFFCIITTSWANPILKLMHDKLKQHNFEVKACCGQGGAVIHGSHGIHSIGVAQVPATSIHTNSGAFSATGNLYNSQAHSSGVHSGHLVHAGAGNSASVYNHFATDNRPILNYGSGHAQVHNVAVAGAGAGAVAAPASLTHTSASLWENAGNPNLAIMQGGGGTFGTAHGHGQSASGWNVNGGHNNYNAHAPSSYGGEAFGNSAAAAAASSAASSWSQQNGGHQDTSNSAFSHSSSSSWSSSHSGTAK